MPATRNTSRSRIVRPVTSSRRTRATPTPSQTETSASELDVLTRHSRQPKRRPARPAPVTEEDEEVPLQKSRRLHVRTSLAGPQIGVLSIERRAEMVADVAGDCLAKLLRSGMNEDRKVKGTSGDGNWRGAWEGLQTLRRTYIFSEYASPFPQLNDVLSDLNNQVRTHTDAATLSRALNMSNLTTFVYVILHPDDAGVTFGESLYEEDDEAEEEVTYRKGKGKARQGVVEMRKNVRARQRLLMLAWKRFWLVVVPREQRESEKALSLWLDFATQITINHCRPTIQTSSLEDRNLPRIDQSLVTSLFSPSAVGRYGQWEMDEEYDTEVGIIESPKKVGIQRKWNHMRTKRTKDLGNLSVETSVKTFPYHEFRQNMITYIQEDVLNSMRDRPAQSRRSTIKRPRGDKKADVESTQDEQSEVESAELSLGAENEDRDEEVLEARNGRDESTGSDVEGPVSIEVLQSVIAEMEAERRATSSITSPLVTPSRKQRLQPGTAEVPTLGSRLPYQDLEDHWDVNDRATPHAIAGAATSRGFDWRARQDDAVQVEWETQESTPHKQKRIRRSVPPPVRDWGAQRASLKDHISPKGRDGRRGVSEIGGGVSLDSVLAQGIQKGRILHMERSVDVEDGEERDDGVTPRAQTRPARELIRRSVPDSHPTSSVPPASRYNTATPGVEPIQFHYDRNNDLLPSDQMLESDIDELQAEGAAPSEDLRTPDDPHFDLLPPLEEDSQNTKSSQSVLGLDVGGDDLEDEMAVDLEVFGEEYESEREDEEGVVDEHADLLPPVMEYYEEENVEDQDGGREFDRNDDQLPPLDEDEELPVDASSWGHAELGEEGEDSEESTPRAAATGPARSKGNALMISAAAGPSRLGRLHMAEPSDYVAPDSEDEAEDRALLRQREFSVQGTADEPPPGQDRYRTESLAPSHNHPADHRAPSNTHHRPSRARSAFTEDGPDPYMIDEDGDDLVPDDAYVIPRDHKAQPSHIHGRVTNQVSSYSRHSGRRKWTKLEEQLLYRTVQKVPLSEEYPLRVVWYFHGEFGVESRDLEMFNPQHMKDKMRVIVASRVNNRRDVVLRARFWLPREHFGREEYDRELGEYKKEVSEMIRGERERLEEEARVRKEKAAEERRRKKEQKKKDGESDSDEDSEDSSDEDGEDDEDGNDGDDGAGEQGEDEVDGVDGGRRRSTRVTENATAKAKAQAKAKAKKGKAKGAGTAKSKDKAAGASVSTPSRGGMSKGQQPVEAEEEEEAGVEVTSEGGGTTSATSQSPTKAPSKKKRHSKAPAKAKKARANRKGAKAADLDVESEDRDAITAGESQTPTAEIEGDVAAEVGGDLALSGADPGVAAEEEQEDDELNAENEAPDGVVEGSEMVNDEDEVHIDPVEGEQEQNKVDGTRLPSRTPSPSAPALDGPEPHRTDQALSLDAEVSQSPRKGKRVRISSLAPPVRRITRSASVQSTQGIPVGKGQMQRRGRSAAEEFESQLEAQDEDENEDDDDELDSEDELDEQIGASMEGAVRGREDVDVDEENEAAVRRAMILKTVRA